MKILRDPQSLGAYLQSCKRPLGWVPTMGYLHEGHLALIKEAKKQNQSVILSVFVNPTQFNEKDDFDAYPRDESRDLSLAKSAGVEAVWLPKHADIYRDGDTFEVSEKIHASQMEGAYRPGHFVGVGTVILKMVQILQAQYVYFGEKDYQQLQLVRDMMRSFFMPVRVIGVVTQREPSGLAMSSRNARLTPEQKNKAASIHENICRQNSAASARAQLVKEGFRVDYVQDYQGRRYVAAWLDEVRLIDNVPLTERE